MRTTATLKELDTRDLIGVEILAPGDWNATKYTLADAQHMIDAHSQLKGRVRPYGKLGHDNGQALAQRDGYPAIGWIDNLYLHGDRLVADFSKVPAKVAALIAAGAYDSVSSEIYFDFELDGKKYPRVLKAVSFLGGDMPAVKDIKSISDVASLYSELKDNKEPTIKTLTWAEEGDTEVELKKLAEALGLPETATEAEVNAKIAANKAAAEAAEAAKLADEKKAKEEPKTSTLSQDEARTLREQVGALTKELAEGKAATAVNAALSSGRIVPAQAEWATSYALSDPTGFESFVKNAPKNPVLKVLGHSEGDEDKEDTSVEDEIGTKIDAQLGSLTPSKEAITRARSGKDINRIAQELAAKN